LEQFKYDLKIVTGHFQPSEHPDFSIISPQYADRQSLYMHKEALKAFIEMFTAAKADGVKLVIKSAARNFDYQKGIWESKWTGKRLLNGKVNAAKKYNSDEARALAILKYSSMPGTSRHHWGTDIDLNSFENKYFERGEGLKVFNWLNEHAHEYGFCRPYTEKGTDRTDGYEEEKWHWSYLPLSQQFTEFASKNLTTENIQGFLGSEVATDIEVIRKYVLGISPSCLH